MFPESNEEERKSSYAYCSFALFEFMEAVQKDLFLLLTSTMVSPLYYVGRVKLYSVVYYNRVANLAQYSTHQGILEIHYM